ncbi:MAG: SAM-dependent methyltransferase, partial [Gammaproteobacteria bacterium]
MLPIRQALGDLPPPTPEALLHSKRLCKRLRDEIADAGGAIGFERFMDLALYAPGLGYYSAGTRKFGAEGDFVTAPELSPLYSCCLALQCAEVLAELGGGDILELGAGTGALAVGMLKKLEQLRQLPARYLILEVSADLRERQRRTLAEQVPALLDKVEWLERLPASFTGMIVANEVLDALPVSRFRRASQGFEEFTVAVEDDRFVWRTRPASAELRAALTTLETNLPQPLVEDYRSEICMRLPAFLYSLADLLTRGALLLVDYGYSRAAYY